MTHEREIILVSILNLLVFTFYLMDTKWPKKFNIHLGFLKSYSAKSFFFKLYFTTYLNLKLYITLQKIFTYL